MRKKTFFGSVALGIAGLALVAPLANASSDEGTMSIEPGAANRGERVLVNARCNWPGGASAKLESTVLEPATLRHKGDGVLSGYAKVKADAEPGGWPVSFQCGDVTVRGALIVKGAGLGDGPTAAPKPAAAKAKAPQETGQVQQKPKGAADTGAGDVAPVDVAAPARQESSGAGMYVLGGVGLLAAGGAGAFFLRRRSRA